LTLNRTAALNNKALLKIKGLSLGFKTEGHDVSITDDVSFQINTGEIYGLVGESGCGKTVTALAILRLLPQPGGKIFSGEIEFAGNNIITMRDKELRSLRGNEISMIFQEPGSALNPLLTIRRQLMECFDYHEYTGNRESRVLELLERVGFSDPNRILASYPHELSGGMAQRAMIAMALIMRPKLIIADEPTTALDVTVQAQIMELLVSLQREFNTSILLIAHNLNLIAQYASRLSVMYAGRIVEESSVDVFLQNPLHPYTKGLLAAMPDLHDDRPDLMPIPGQVPQPEDFQSGCRFRERCFQAMDACLAKPELVEINEYQKIACFLHKGEKKV